MARSLPLRFQPRTLVIATVLIAVTLLTLVLVPQILARDARLEVLRQHVDQVARLAASHVDGDLHRELLAGNADEATLARARVPLLRLHEGWPEAFYVYTMGEIEGRARFILDTAQDAQFAARRGMERNVMRSSNVTLAGRRCGVTASLLRGGLRRAVRAQDRESYRAGQEQRGGL